MITFTEQIHANCRHERYKKAGTTKAGTQRYKCLDCGKRFTESTALFAGMRIGLDKAAQVIELICEGMSTRATARVTGVSLPTILELLMVVGPRCQQFLERTVRGVEASDVQCDEIWQFIYCKRRTAQKLEQIGFGGPCGDSYCFTAVERTSKLVLAWHFGRRYLSDTVEFCRKLRHATAGRFHLSTDGYQPYIQAVARQLADRVDYGMLVKIYAKGTAEDRRTYSPAPIVGMKKYAISGRPEINRICTSHTERHNGSMRTFNKRMGRLTYCFSKKWENHGAALGLYFAHFNFCRKHRTLKGRTPAMAAGIADHVWTVRELLGAIAA